MRQKLPYPDLSMRVHLVPMQLSEKIVFAMIVWVTFALILAFNSGIEVFLTLILIGVLVVRELTDSFTPVKTKERIDFFIYTFLVVFAIIVVRRVWEILA
ncbi:MAG TPA: hypothetical protein HA364_00230 [Thermoplasmata archaeon]|nr:hypothetical protein [Thermoplasmata archaeon]